jgi:hypothetical protein
MSNLLRDFETGLSGMKTAAENQIQVKETVAA